MSEKGRSNVFDKFNWFPFQHQYKHANELLNFQGDKAGDRRLTDILSDPADEFRCAKLTEKLGGAWRDELRRHGTGAASLARVLFSAFALDWIKLACWIVLGRIVFGILILHFLRQFLIDSFVLGEIFYITNDSNATLSPIEALEVESGRDSRLVARHVALGGIVLSLTVYIAAQPMISLASARCGLTLADK